MINNLDLWSLIANAGGFVQSIMALLLLLSCISWYFIVLKSIQLRQTTKNLQLWEERIRHAPSDSYQNLLKDRNLLHRNPLGKIFVAGFAESLRLVKKNTGSAQVLSSGVERAMQGVLQLESEELERHLPFLSTVASVSPYVGLLGTVWGIMHAFSGLTLTGTTTLAQVAPGISEALIATAMGLAAAIPALIAYNQFISRIDRMIARCESILYDSTNYFSRTHSFDGNP